MRPLSRTRPSIARSDNELMADVIAGSVEGFGELFDRYCDRAYRVAWSVCRDDARAQDTVQGAFLSVWTSRGSYRPGRGTVAAWLLTVVHHRAIDLVRRDGSYDSRRASDDQRDAHPDGDDVCEKAINRDHADRLQASLAMLPQAQQEVIILAYWGQLSHTEIAAQLDLPAGTVKGRMRLGLEKLRTSLEREAV